MRRTAVVAIAVAALFASALTTNVEAHFLPHEDANDVDGDLDIKRVSIDRVDKHTTTISIRTYDRFKIDDLYGDNGFTAYVDSRGDKRYDFLITMDLYEDSYFYCNVYDRAGYSRGGGKMEKTARTVTCPLSATPFDATKSVRWRIRSVSGREVDQAPNRGWFKH